MNAYNGSKHEAKPKTQRYSKRQHLKTRKMNQKPYNKCLINLVCSICTGKYLPFFFFRTDLAPSLLGLYENIRQILSRAGLALG